MAANGMSVERNMGVRRVGSGRGEHGGKANSACFLSHLKSSTILTEKGGCQHSRPMFRLEKQYNLRGLAPVVSAPLMPRRFARGMCARVGLEPSGPMKLHQRSRYWLNHLR